MALARTKEASAELGVASWSRAGLRQRPAQAKVRSTTQRRGSTGKLLETGGGSWSAGHRIQRRGLRTTRTLNPKVSSIQATTLP